MRLKQKHAKRGLMQRLLRSEEGNVALVSAALIIPMTLMLGSGIDFSRYYVIKSRMQMACDAGALAGRKMMGKQSFTTAALAEANTFFDTNFVEGSYGSRDLEREFTENDGIVEGRASVAIDNMILGLANIDEFEIAVECNGRLDIANTDVTFVLDTTGSMDTVDAGSTGSRMQGLRDAVKDFANAMDQAKSANTVIRYGFVPYSSNVRVGHLLRREWIADTNIIESREAVVDGSFVTVDSDVSGWTYVSGTVTGYNARPSRCRRSYATVTNLPDQVTIVENPDGTRTVTTIQTAELEGVDAQCYSGRLIGTNYHDAIYRRNVVATERPNITWHYGKVTYDLTALKGSNGLLAAPGATQNFPVGNMSNFAPTDRALAWNGCIEEARTQEFTGPASVTNDVYDLKINHVPDDTDPSKTWDKQWKMQVPGLAFGRGMTITPLPNHYYQPSGSLVENEFNDNADFYNAQDAEMAACLNPARALENMSTGQVGTYIDGLIAKGSTYPDLGMIWGGRLASPNGIFGSSNTAAASAGLTRHVVFMTDGETYPVDVSYNAYGIEPLDQRRSDFFNSNPDTDLKDQINERLLYVCDQIKNENITLWVVAFGPTVLSSVETKAILEDCATPGKYFEAANNTILRAQFVAIASQIAELRLVQ